MISQLQKLSVLIVLLTLNLWAQEMTISGTVSDDTGPFPDITIQIKGQETGTITDFDGHYSIKANKNDILVFNHVLFKTIEKTIGDNTIIDVHLVENIEITSCFFGPSKWMDLYYSKSLNYNLNGLKLDVFLNDFYKKKHVFFKTTYLSDFKDNSELSFSFGSSFTIKDHYTRIDLKYDDIKNTDIMFQRTSYLLNMKTNFYHKKIERTTSVLYGLGVSKIELRKWRPGYQFGLKHFLPLGLSIYSKVIFWTNYWEFNSGLNWQYRKFKIFIEHQNIKQYNDYKVGIGYRFYI